MKKVIIVLFFLTLIIVSQKTDEFIIPSDAIRFRIIANSNSFEDQAQKMIIKKNINNLIKDDLINITNKNNAKEYLVKEIPEIKKTIDNYNIPYQINYGNNYFPEKKYKGITYEAGNYESLVVTLGEGIGDNWWCLLYPPLCFLDDDSPSDEVEYKFFIKDMFKKYL